MATKEFHDFDDKTLVADIEAVSDFELLAGKTGNNGLNVPLSALKAWVLAGDVGGDEYNVKTAVDALRVAVTGTVLTLNGKTLTSAADRITANTDLYVNSKKVAQETTAPTFTDITATTVQASTGSNDRISFSQDLLKLYVGGIEGFSLARGGGINTATFAANVALGANDLTTAGTINAGVYSFQGNVARVHLETSAIKIQPTANDSTLEVGDGEVRFTGNGAGTNKVVTVENDTVGDSGFEVESGATQALGGGIYVVRTTVVAGDYSAFAVKGSGAQINFTMPGYEAGGGFDQGTSGRITFTAKEGVVLDSDTDLTLDASKSLTWRYATPSQDGLLSAAQAADIAKITAIEEANGDLTQELGFQTLNDGTNARTATAGDRVLNITTTSADITAVVNPTGGTTELTLGVTAAMVKLTGAQTLTDKTLLAATNTIEATSLQTTPISTTAPTDNQILKFDSVSGEWQPEAEAAVSGDPILTKGLLTAPSLSFQGDQGATSGIYHKITSPYTSAIDGVCIVQSGVRSAIFSEAGVTIDNSLLVQKHGWFGVSRTTENTSDIVLRTGSGIRGNTLRKSIIFKCASRDVAEMTQDRLKLNSGLSLKVRFVTEDEDLRQSDSVLMCSGNCKTVTLPEASTSTGQLMIIGAAAASGSSQAIGGSAASTVDVIGFSDDGGITRDAIDGKTDGVKITANETAMFICDGAKWMRLGGVAGSSAPVAASVFTKLMLNFKNIETYSANPSGAVVYPYLDTTFANANEIAATSASVALKDADTGDPADVTWEKRFGNATNYFSTMSAGPTLKESRDFWWVTCSLENLVSGSEAQPYFTINRLPAGTYKLLVLGGYPGYSNYSLRVIVTEADAIVPGGGDVAYSNELADPVQSYLALDKVRVLGDTGSTVAAGQVYQPNQLIDAGLAATTFTVGAKQDVRFYITQGLVTDLKWANIQAAYLIKTA